MRFLWMVFALAAVGCGSSQPQATTAPKGSAVPVVEKAANNSAAADAGATACCSVEDMRADLKALQELLESSHPDPYVRAGGVEAFRGRFAEAERSLPASGLDVTEWYMRLRPLIAQIRDGHTSLRAPAGGKDDAKVMLELEIIDERLVVDAVYDEAARTSIGTVVTAVEGVPVATLASRMAERRGYENVYTNLIHLASALGHSSSLADLVGHAVDGQVRFEVRARDGSTQTVSVPTVRAAKADASTRAKPIVMPTKIALPERDATGIGSGFLRPDGQTAVLRIDSAMKYREAFEVWRATGYISNLSEHLDEVVRDVTGQAPPTSMSVDQRILAIPSLTERLMKLFGEMKAKKTKLLIVDLRENDGGNSAFASILEYFLYPMDATVGADHGYQVPRYSALYFANHTTDTLEKVRARTRPDFALGDSDPTEEVAWRAGHGKPLSPAEKARRLGQFEAAVKMVPTFEAAVAKRSWNASWRPRVVVLTSARTYSAGFDAALQLRAHGAKVAGVPSAQAANCFIDALGFELPRSHLRGSISYKRSVGLPDDPKQGELLRPDTVLTYEAHAAHAFDPNAIYDIVEPGSAARR